MTDAAASTGTGSAVLDYVAEVIGEAAAIALAWEFRGEKFYVPIDHTNEPRFAATIGEEQAARLCSAFWRLTFELPFREAARRRVIELNREGFTRREIARALRISERQVYRLLESSPAPQRVRGKQRDDRQLDMF